MQRVARYVLGLLIFGAFVIAGLYTAYAVATELPLAVEANDWPATQGVVVESKLSRRKGKSRHRLVYSYEADHQFFESRRIAFMGGVFRDNPRSTANRYPKGESVTVYYAPDRPEISVLETDVWWLGFIVATLLAFGFVTIGGVGLRKTFK